MERFFEALEAETDWLHTTTPSSWLAEHAPLARVYLPGGSYAEMGEWALEPDEAEAYRDTLRADLAERRPEPRWMHGASWRNFQHRYREVNDLHKQMLRTSAKVGTLAPGPVRDRAVDQLQRGQGNDPYWHGLFGGLYLSHLRTAAAGHLIAAEDLADGEARRLGRSPDGAFIRDLDLDGRPEILLSAPGQVVTVKPDEGAGIGAWDVRAVHHPLTAVLRRRPEAYHRHLADVEALPPGEEPSGVISPHERIVSRQAGLGRALTYDAYERRSALVRLVQPAIAAHLVASGLYDGPDDFVAGPFDLTRLVRGGAEFVRRGVFVGRRGAQTVEVTKVVTVDRRRRRPGLTVSVTVRPLQRRLDATLCLEWALNLSGGGANPAAFYEPAPGTQVRFDGVGGVPAATRLRFGNRDVGLVVTARAEPAARIAWASIDTVSLSEAGAERMHQGSCLVFAWPLRLAAGTSRTVRLTMEAVTDRDTAAV